jgi:hypothetical protein
MTANLFQRAGAGLFDWMEAESVCQPAFLAFPCYSIARLS